MAVIDHTSSFRRRIWNFFFYCAGGFTLLSLSLMSGGMKNCDEEPLSSGTSAFEGVVIRGRNVGFAGEMWFWGDSVFLFSSC